MPNFINKQQDENIENSEENNYEEESYEQDDAEKNDIPYNINKNPWYLQLKK